MHETQLVYKLRLQLMYSNVNNFSPTTKKPNFNYGKCPKISNFEVSDKIANKNSVDPDQTAPNEQSDQGLHCLTVHLFTLRNNCMKSKM